MSDAPLTLLTYAQAAEVLDVSDRTVWKLVNVTGELRAARIGRSVRIDRRDLDDFIERSKVAMGRGMLASRRAI